MITKTELANLPNSNWKYGPRYTYWYWTMTPVNGSMTNVYYAHWNGAIYQDNIYYGKGNGVLISSIRPVVNLKKSAIE